MSSQTWAIFMRPLVDQFRNGGFALSEPSLRFYPDGSALCIANGEFYREARAFIRETDPDCEAMVNFRPLAPFGNRDYYINYPGWYADLRGKYDEQGSFLAPGGASPILRCEYELSRVRVLIQLHRKIGKGTPEELADALRRWFVDIGVKGVFGGGGVVSMSSVLRYMSKDATFDVDASQAGEHTMITLVLAILNWAIDCRRPLKLVNFVAGRPQFYEWDDGPRQYEELLRSPLTVPLT